MVLIAGWIPATIDRINPDIPCEAREEAFRKILRVATPSLVGANGRQPHWMLRDGVEVEASPPGRFDRQGPRCNFIDYD